MHQPHIDTFGTLGIPAYFIGGEDQVKVPAVLFLPLCPDIGRFFPGVEAAEGDAGKAAQFLYGKPVVSLLKAVMDDLECGRSIIHKRGTYFPVVLVDEIFFKNSICCSRYSTFCSSLSMRFCWDWASGSSLSEVSAEGRRPEKNHPLSGILS